jgi:hypothetical protein
MRNGMLRLIGRSAPDVATETTERVPWTLKARQWPRRVLGAIGRSVLLRLGVARITPLIYWDEVECQQLTINRSGRYVILSVGSRSYYFDALTGELDGTGSLAVR